MSQTATAAFSQHSVSSDDSMKNSSAMDIPTSEVDGTQAEKWNENNSWAVVILPWND